MSSRGARGDFDLVIVGGGATAMVMAGVAAARGIAPADRIAVVAEASPESNVAAAPDWDLRVFALSRASQRLLEICGVWQRLPGERMCAYERMCVWDSAGEPDGRGSISFDSALLGEPDLGVIVEGRALGAAARAAAAAAGVLIVDGSVGSIACEPQHRRIRLKDGRNLISALLIAADGAESASREMLGIETAGHGYAQDALVAHVRCAKPHRHTAWQRFLPTGPLAFLPLPDGRSSIVWSVARCEAARLRALDAGRFAEELTAASGECLGVCEVTTPVLGFALKLQYAHRYVAPRAVLIGDAAHVVHPMAGQGLNLGLLDCAVLAEVLADADPGVAGALGDPKLLRRYERRRRPENLLAATALDGLERLFSSGHPAVAGLRAAALGAAGRSQLLKREFALRALGLSGDIPGYLKS